MGNEEQVAQPQEAKKEQPKASNASMLGCFVVFLVVIGGGIIWLMGGSGGSTRETIRMPNGQTLSTLDLLPICRDLIRAQLSQPQTASFLGELRSNATSPAKRGNSLWQWSEVDSRNALGGTVRTRWYCEVNGDTGQRIAEQRPLLSR